MAASQMSLLLLPLLTLTTSTSAQMTIYDLVVTYGFPPGILPNSVTSYTIAPALEDDSFTFVVNLIEPCYVNFEYTVYFDSKITGKISYGQITELKGLQAKSFVFWLNIDEMTVDPSGTSIDFTLGLITVKLDIKQFLIIPYCKDKALADCDHSLNRRISKLPITTK